MDTKWKSRTLLVLYSFLLAVGLIGPLSLMAQGSRYLHLDYYRTPAFRWQLDQFASYLNLFELNAFSKQQLKAAITADESDIAEYRNRQGPLTARAASLRDEYEPYIQEALAGGNQEAADFYTAERDGKLDDLMKLFKDDDYAAKLVRKEKEQQVDTFFKQREIYRPDYNRLLSRFDYYFSNDSTRFVHTSLNLTNERSARRELYGDGHPYATSYTIDVANSLHYRLQGNDLLRDSILPYQGWLAVPKDSPLRAEAAQYRREQLILLACCLVFIALLVASARRYKLLVSAIDGTSGWKPHYRKLPPDVQAALLIGTAALAIGPLASMASHYPAMLEALLVYGGRLLAALLLATLGIALSLLQGRALAGELRSWDDIRREWPRSWLKRGGSRARGRITQAVHLAKDSFVYKSAGIRLLALALVWIGLGFIGGWTAYAFVRNYDNAVFFAAPVLAIAAIVAFLLYARQFGYLNRVAKAAEELAAGRMPSELAPSGSGVLSSLAVHINALGRGVKTLQHEQVKSERLKTELITNVSHDLRTPLTSIITYVGLLNSEETTAEERAAYVEIIDQKSKRLKTMIDDLFEVSAMTSGNTKLHLERTDLVQLMQQALAEYKEVMDGSDVQFRVSLPEEPIYAPADGQKLWRVFDNLIGNMMKYALDRSRAYISMQLSGRQEVAIAFKNVSKYELGDNADELFERFKRGDPSRHTEGSGLGLAIAKSIVDLHDGRLTLETDGDLFKATVILRREDSPAKH